MSYFLVSWDISASEPAWSQVDKRLRDCFEHLPYIKPVNTFYMIRVLTRDQYNQVFTALQTVAKNSVIQVRFIMTPILNNTGFDGWLDTEIWNGVRQITGQPVFR